MRVHRRCMLVCSDANLCVKDAHALLHALLCVPRPANESRRGAGVDTLNRVHGDANPCHHKGDVSVHPLNRGR